MSWEAECAELKERELFRSLTLKNDSLLDFSSNDYLNLANSTELKRAAKDAIDSFGTGATGSRLMSGHLEIHEKLEARLAEFLGYEAALVFGSGFLTNLGVVSALARSGDVICFDKLNHASLIDGVRASGAKWKRYKHCDVGSLEKLLTKNKNTNNGGRQFILTDSLFSMDGDIAPLKELDAVARDAGAHLIVDEAHALGVMGPCGRGLACDAGVKPSVITATFSKAFGGYGGFVVASNEVRDLLINRARSFIFSTALPPASVASALEAVRMFEGDESLGEKLMGRARYFHTLLKEGGLNLLPFASPIIPVMLGSNTSALTAAKTLLGEGIFVKAIRPPTVPPNTARLRFTVTLMHSKEVLARAARIVIRVVKDVLR